MESIEFKKSTMWKGIAVVLLIVAVFFMFKGKMEFSGNSVVEISDSGFVEVRTSLQGFEYNPSTITVKRGSMVRLTIVNKDNVNHGLHLPQFGVVSNIPSLSTKTVEFKAVETSTNGVAMPTCSQEHGEKLTFNVV